MNVKKKKIGSMRKVRKFFHELKCPNISFEVTNNSKHLYLWI